MSDVDRAGAARACMRKMDVLPAEFRALVHRYGSVAFKAWLYGWTPEQILAAATPDGCFTTRRPKKHNAMGVPRRLFGPDLTAALPIGGTERPGVERGREP